MPTCEEELYERKSLVDNFALEQDRSVLWEEGFEASLNGKVPHLPRRFELQPKEIEAPIEEEKDEPMKVTTLESNETNLDVVIEVENPEGSGCMEEASAGQSQVEQLSNRKPSED